jgi:serine/threonine protein kinase
MEQALLKKLNLGPIWSEVMGQYQLLKTVGKGTYGTVVSAKCRISGQKVAIKHIKDFKKYDYDICKVLREI